MIGRVLFPRSSQNQMLLLTDNHVSPSLNLTSWLVEPPGLQRPCKFGFFVDRFCQQLGFMNLTPGEGKDWHTVSI
mgnify:FL=1